MVPATSSSQPYPGSPPPISQQASRFFWPTIYARRCNWRRNRRFASGMSRHCRSMSSVLRRFSLLGMSYFRVRQPTTQTVTARSVMSSGTCRPSTSFEFICLPPIHPIGSTNRKGKNNSLIATPDDVGSPYAIGGTEGGHDAIHSALGTIDDFRLLRQACSAHGIELALDFAIQYSPDH